MSQKKMVSRNVAIALGIICIILVAGLGIVLFMGYSPTLGSSTTSLQSQLNDLNATYNSYLSTHGHTDSDYNSLSTQNTNLQNQNTNLQNQMTAINSTYNDYVANHQHTNSEYNSMWDAVLIPVDLQGSDNNAWWHTPYLHVAGYVVNVHRNWAFNCRLHVVAYQSGGVTAFDTYIQIGWNNGTMPGQSYYLVGSDISYAGGSLTSWTITPEWTITP